MTGSGPPIRVGWPRRLSRLSAAHRQAGRRAPVQLKCWSHCPRTRTYRRGRRYRRCRPSGIGRFLSLPARGRPGPGATGSTTTRQAMHRSEARPGVGAVVDAVEVAAQPELQKDRHCDGCANAGRQQAAPPACNSAITAGETGGRTVPLWPETRNVGGGLGAENNSA